MGQQTNVSGSRAAITLKTSFPQVNE
jgi:hypothetical protein